MFSACKLYCYIFLCLGFISAHASTPRGGLKFHGSEQPINQRTSYDVFGDHAVEFKDQFDLTFNLALYPTTEFGYIVRIKNKSDNRIFHLFYDGQGGNLVFKFNEEGKNNLIVATIDRNSLVNDHWFEMKVAFDLKSDSIHLTIHNQTFSAAVEKLPDVYHPVVLFGKSDHIIDVPSFALKDLSIGNTEKYSFDFNEREGNGVHDINGDVIGNVSNPEWLINDAYHWKYHISFNSKSVAGANYNTEKKEVYYFNRDTLQLYNVRTGDTDIKVFNEQSPVRLFLGMNFVNTKTNKLYSYETYYPHPNQDYKGPTVASLDLNTFEWTAENFDQLSSPLHHHGTYFNQATEEHTIYGGFGNMRYGKEFFSYNIQKKKWDTLGGFTGDFLSPRYFTSMGYSEKNNSLYIFGGMGNESGEQTVGRKYLYDLYKIDLTTKKISKLWEIEWKGDNVVPVRRMVIADDSTFYTLCYPEHVSESLLKLYRFSMKDGQHTILGDSIPIRSDKIATNANLYYDKGLNSLFAIVQEFDDDIASRMKVYSLSFPPITASELENYSAKDNKTSTAIFIAVALLIALIVFYVVYKKYSVKDSVNLESDIRTLDLSTKAEQATRPSSIYLFGELTVRDRKNKDITYMFSAQLKQILCLILQYSATEGGIASQKLSNILWPDKPADKVKNSRGVTINHLRKALSELDGIELIFEKGYFKLEHTDAFYCDYTRCMEIISTNTLDQHKDELIAIISRGKFLQLSDHELYDSFKEEVEKKLEPVLLLEMEKSFEAELYQTTIAFAEGIANIDPLNEVAMNFQLKALQRLKMNDEARIRYQTFVIEYKKVMGSEYPHPYKGIV